jgi:uncharacterized protein (DUF1015 family)
MAEVRPFRALRFSAGIGLGSVICPPFDVISTEEQDALYERSPYNAVRLELPRGNGDRYQRAATTLRSWVAQGVLKQDHSPAFYLLEQGFTHRGRQYRRRALFGRVGLEPWETGVVRPHERTLGPPKEDRLNLLRAVRANISPIFGLYDDPDGEIGAILQRTTERIPPLARFQDPEGLEYVLWRLDELGFIRVIQERLAGRTIYIADGHHRYETALLYRDERHRQAKEWTGEEPENFVLMGLVAATDPGLTLLPLHRLVRSPVPLDRALEALMPVFDIELVSSLPRLLELLEERGKAITTLGMAAAGSPDLYLLSALDVEAIARLLPPDAPRQWAHIDTAVLQVAVLSPALGVDEAQVQRGEAVQYTEDAEEALALVRQGHFDYAFFVNPARPRQIMKVADAGQRMPPKSTYFYPKLPAGLLINPLDA